MMNINKNKQRYIFFAILMCALIGVTGCTLIKNEANNNSNESHSITESSIDDNEPIQNTEEQADEKETIPDITETEPTLSEEEILNLEIDKILQQMTLDEKIYQLFIITPEALTRYETVTEAGETTKKSLQEHPVGGLVYFSKNLVNPEQTSKMLTNTLNYFYEIYGMPAFLCIDEEGGSVARIGNNKAFAVEKVPAMADISSKEEAYDVGCTIGRYLSDLGFNFNFAPDADVLTNSKNNVIGNRSFGEDAEQVINYATAVSDGLHSQNIMSIFKHFPGHGATTADTHEGFAYTDKTYEELLKDELQPFAAAGDAGVDGIMVSHISVPQIVGDNTPCTLSDVMITDILREDLQFNGLIVTDALDMGAITEKYSADEAAVMAISAGIDILLMPEDFEKAFTGIAKAVENGNITEERINESVRRIIRAKLLIN